MFKKQMIKLKRLFNSNSGNNDTNNTNDNNNTNNKKKIENISYFIIVLVITLIIINTILKDNKNTNNSKYNNYNNNVENSSSKVLSKNDSYMNNDYSNGNSNQDLEDNLEDILSKIEGVGKVRVLITYSSSSQLQALYNEDTSIKDTSEKDSSGGDRKINETSNKKEVIYKEVNGEKVPVTQSIINPTIEGAIVIAKGANSSQVKLNITQAVEAATGLPTHKIQVFEMANN